ncbi:nitrate- and nitrite sensing domain-containing protein [Streptomyces sp. NPDC046939]|uniref:sensor histidine kinase n=1 Tax=Streptomyces sp. NPDC046939 TaxID=3155376 RepID=UPI0033EBB2A3
MPVGKGKRARVRNRLIIAVAVVAAAVVGAGAPTLIAASGRVGESQGLVDDAERTQRAVALSHALADERDEVSAYIAAGRPKGRGLSEQRSARVDRQVEELRADAEGSLRSTVDDIAAVRRSALTGKGTALEAHTAYSKAITELHRLAEELADAMPPRAGSGAHALADLDRAVDQASAARGLLLAAYAVPRSTTTTIDPVTGLPKTVQSADSPQSKQRDALSAAAQRARVREQAALDDFRDSAPAASVSAYDSTVTGADIEKADTYLDRLTDAPTLSDDELGYNTKNVDAALTARIDAMRGAEAALGDQRVKNLERLRDDDVDGLEIRVALVGVCLLAALGFATGAARSLTRPLAVVRIGSARVAESPATEEPIKFTGRNDEFAQVVRSVNALHAHAVALHERQGTLESDRKHLVGERQRMADDRDKLRAELADATAQLERAKHSINGTFVNLALRTLGLVERQLGIIESLEDREQDPEQLATLFKLDHFATVMRRHSENLLVLAGAEHGQQHAGSVPLVDVLRAAVSEIERYERVRIAALPPHAHIAGFAADDLSHLVAELLENATSFSPPDAAVEVSAWLLENGEVMLSVQDEGIGMAEDKMRELNARLTAFSADQVHDPEDTDGLGLGLYVVARLAARHGIRVRLREQKQGGVAAVVVLPTALLAAVPAVAAPPPVPVPGAAPAVHLPGSEAEANSNVLTAIRTPTTPNEPATPTPDGTDTPAPNESATPAPDGTATPAPDAAHAPAPNGAHAPAPTESDAPDPAQAANASDPGEVPAPGAGDRSAPLAASTSVPGGGSAPVAGDASAPGEAAAPAGASDPDQVSASGAALHAGGASRAGQGPEQAGAADPADTQRPDQDPVHPATPEDPVIQAAEEAVRAAGLDGAGGRGESESETTMELLAPTPPEAPAGTAAPGATEEPRPVENPAEPPAGDVPAPRPPRWERVTDKGLPKRTPKVTGPVAVERPRAGAVDAEALRRRLGGFHSGALKGRRDVEAEIEERIGEAKGDTAEEASS